MLNLNFEDDFLSLGKLWLSLFWRLLLLYDDVCAFPPTLLQLLALEPDDLGSRESGNYHCDYVFKFFGKEKERRERKYPHLPPKNLHGAQTHWFYSPSRRESSCLHCQVLLFYYLMVRPVRLNTWHLRGLASTRGEIENIKLSAT